MMLVLDVESTGLARDDLPLTHPEQPNAVEIAALLVTPEGETRSHIWLRLEPEEQWQFTAKAQEINGVDRREAVATGVPPRTALSVISNLAKKVRQIACWNPDHDRAVLSGMLQRMKVDPATSITRPALAWINVMDIAAIPCGIEREDGSIKWPKLSEASRILLGKAHDESVKSAWTDACRTLEIYQHLHVARVVSDAA